nr:retroviral-like aspartic protease family protein [Aestuariibacter sp. A3R04]
MYVDVVIDEMVSASFLVDTGSGLLTLNEATFKKWKKVSEGMILSPMAARLANGKIQKVARYQIGSVSIDGRCEIGPIDVAVMPGGANILGINALMKAAPITITSSQLVLGGCSDMIAQKK